MLRFVRFLPALLVFLVGSSFSLGQSTSAPSIYGVLGGGTVELGQTVTLSVGYNDSVTTGFTHQWRKSGTNIAGATNATYVIAAATAADAGAYSVVVSNSVGSSVGSTEIIVKAAAAPVITSAPRAQAAQVGQTVTFSFTATGSYPRSHQWRKDGVDIPGATNATLPLTNITTAQAGIYAVTLSNSLGTVTSTSAALTVNAAQPPGTLSVSSDTTVLQGQRLSLSVSIFSGSSPFTIQWRKDGAAIAAGTDSTFAINTVTLADAGDYSVVVSNVAGSVTSRNIKVTVSPATPPSFFSHPRAVTAFVGQRVSFDISINGTSPFTYQWSKNGTTIPGATSSSYSINAVALADAGSFTVTVGNIAGALTSNAAVLTVNPPVAPRITTEPLDIETSEGSYVSLSVNASGSPSPTLQWYRNGVAINGAQSSSYYFSSAKSSDSADYHVVATNAGGSATSRTARVEVAPPPLPPLVRLNNGTFTIGQSLSLNAYGSSSGYGTLSYQWYRNGQAIQGATSESYSVSSATGAHAGDYYVIISNATGSTTSWVSRMTPVLSSTPPPGAWVAAQRYGNIIYFAFPNPARIERFDVTSESWLTALNLPRAMSAMAIGQDSIYTSAGSIVYRYTLTGTSETIVSSAFSDTIGGLVLSGGFLIVQSGGSNGRVASIRLADNAVVSNRSFTYYWGPNMVAMSGARKLLSLATGLSSNILSSLGLAADGTLDTRLTSSSNSYDVSGVNRLYLLPGENHVVDNSGTVYQTSDLRASGSLGGALQDVAFTGNSELVVLRSGQLTRYATDLRETGLLSIELTDASRVFVHGDAVFAFAYPQTGGSIRHTKGSLARFGGPEAAPALDGATLAFIPDRTFLDRDGNLLLFSRHHRQVFRWSPSRRAYLAPITLQGWPNAAGYSPTAHRLYFGYNNQRVQQVKLDAGSTLEEAFASTASPVGSITPVGDHVLVMSTNYSSSSGSVLTLAGAQTATLTPYGVLDVVWNPSVRRIIYLRESSYGFSSVELLANGTTGTARDGSYNGSFLARAPLKLTPDGGSVLIGTGKFYDANTFAANASIANALEDAAWLGRLLVTGRTTSRGAELQRWGGNNYALDRTRLLPGRLFSLHALSDTRLLAVTIAGNTVSLTILDTDLNELSTDSAGPPNRIANLAARAMVGRGDQILIPGFVVTGTQPKKVLVRAVGPALAGFGVAGTLADPQLTIVNNANATVAANDDWGTAANLTELNEVTARVGAFALSTGSKDAVALVSLQPGAYSVQTRGVGDTTGIAMVEVYDAQEAGNSGKLVNIAARAQVGTGADILIPGIVIQGAASKTLLIRAVGPGLTQFGVGGVLANPRLRLFRGSVQLQENDDWDKAGDTNTSNIIGAAQRAGAFALAAGAKDAAILVTLPPGAYTAQISGADGGSGVALVELYEVNN